MLWDRYAYENLFTQIPSLSLRMEPVLAQLDQLLDDDQLFRRVRQDLARRYPQTLSRGRHSTPVEVILRMLVVMRLYGWSFEQTEYFVSDSLVLRQFCRVYAHAAPDDTTLIKWAKLIGPETLAQLHERVVELARQRKITRGRKLRADTTVVRTPIHYPTDSSLLVDGVRGVGRLLRRARPVLEALAAATGAAVKWTQRTFQDHTRGARQRAQRILQIARRRGQEAEERRAELQTTYTPLLQAARQSRAQARRVLELLKEGAREGATALAATAGKAAQAAQRLTEQLEAWLPRLEQVLEQTTRRVLWGEVVAAKEKLVSLSEPHTQIIKRGKAGREVEFGRKLWLDEVEGGIVSGYELLPEPSNDASHLAEHLEQHQTRFGKAPALLAGDRGLYSSQNVRQAEAAGVKQVVIPATGRPSQAQQARQRQGWFRRGRHFRAGIEGRISVLARRFGLADCRYHGATGTERWVGWGIITHNLWQIARTEAFR
jgi:IS5 family transposase